MFEKTIEELKNFGLESKKFLYAFSGGPDSVFLLLLMHDILGDMMRDHVELCYVNYHDSDEVDAEERIVYFYAGKYNLIMHRRDVVHQESDGNFEEFARNYRYDEFKKIVEENNMEGVITAHQKNDSVETYLLQKERGNLPRHYGLSEVSDLDGLKVFRPMLDLTKEEIYDYLDKNDFIFYEDKTNHDDHTKRNLIRKEEGYELLIDGVFAEIEKKNLALDELNTLFDSLEFPITFDTYLSLDGDEKKRLCFRLTRNLNVPFRRKHGIAAEIGEFLKRRTNGVLELDGTNFLYKTTNYFFIYADTSKVSYSFTYNEPGIYRNEWFSIDLNSPSLFNIFEFPVTIRNHREDDCFATKLTPNRVSEFLKRQGVPYFMVPLYPTLLVDDRIQGVPFWSDLKNGVLPFEFTFLKK